MKSWSNILRILKLCYGHQQQCSAAGKIAAESYLSDVGRNEPGVQTFYSLK